MCVHCRTRVEFIILWFSPKLKGKQILQYFKAKLRKGKGGGRLIGEKTIKDFLLKAGEKVFRA